LSVHCVSRPAGQDFARFLHDYRHFHAHCVSRGVPHYFRQRVAIQRLADDSLAAHALAQAALDVVVRMTRVPRRARAPMARLLARIATTAALTLARTSVRLKPLAALSARSLASHRCCLLKARSVSRISTRDEVAALQAISRSGSFFASTPGSFLASGEARRLPS
jgi:hypothetical protein